MGTRSKGKYKIIKSRQLSPKNKEGKQEYNIVIMGIRTKGGRNARRYS